MQPQPEKIITRHTGISVCSPVEVPEAQNREQIAALAYQLWQDRGCPEGTPDEDWFRAERELARSKRIDEKEVGSLDSTERSIAAEEADSPVLRFPVRSEIAQATHTASRRA